MCIQKQLSGLRKMLPSSKVPYIPFHGPATTKAFTPTTYYLQSHELGSKSNPTPEQGNVEMAEEKELAKALALLALPNR